MENILEIKTDLKEGLFQIKWLLSWIDSLDRYYKTEIPVFYLDELKEKSKKINEILLRLTFNLIKE